MPADGTEQIPVSESISRHHTRVRPAELFFVVWNPGLWETEPQSKGTQATDITLYPQPPIETGREMKPLIILHGILHSVSSAPNVSQITEERGFKSLWWPQTSVLLFRHLGIVLVRVKAAMVEALWLLF